MKTFMAKSNILGKKWYIVDATDKVLGRFSSMIARYLIGKHKVEYTPHVDIGDYVIVLNAQKIFVTGRKINDKIYYHHTGYVGGIKKSSFKEMILHKPERVIEIAVKGMLPKNHLGRVMYQRLKVYSGNENIHAAQMPNFLDF